MAHHRTTCEPGRTSPYHVDIRLRMLWQRYAQQKTLRQIACNFCVSAGTVSNIAMLYETTGSLSPRKPVKVPELPATRCMHRFLNFHRFFPFSCENIEVKIPKSRLKPAEQRSNNPQSEGKGLATLGWSSTSHSLDGARTLLLLCQNDRDSAA